MKHKFLALTIATLLAGTANVYALEDKPQPKSLEAQINEPIDPKILAECPSPKMMEQKLAQRLKLTEEQQKAIEERRKADREKLKPLFAQMKEIRKQMNEIRKANMEAFESQLTPEQKQEFKKMMEEKGPRHHRKMKRPPHHPMPMEPQDKEPMPPLPDTPELPPVVE